MADKIKKFFQKKKVEAKFKLAGPGHTLSETSRPVRSSQQSFDTPAPGRTGLSTESKVAAEAALARLQSKRENPKFNTSLAAVQAQVRKELEAESHSPHQPSAPRTVNTETDVPRNYAASGVYFRCPLIGNEVLLKEEWRKKIKSFLYEQLEEERGLTACLIIHSCNFNRDKITACVDTLCKYLENIINNPEEEKYRKIRMSNKVFTDKVQPIEGSLELLLAAGFTQENLVNKDGIEEKYLVFNESLVESLETLNTLIDALKTAEPIQLELDRNMQVLLPSQAASNNQLPPSFYALTAEEFKREHQLRAEAMEKSQMLRTKAMREKDELREMKKYKFAIIRIRFPDGILLQGTFSVYEHYSAIHSFVQENLEHNLPFVLNTPTGHKLLPDEDAEKTLIDLRLVPATVLTFAWHSSVADQINKSPNKDVFLKPEIMILVKEV